MTNHLTIPGSLEWDSSEVDSFSIATLRYAGGKEHDVRYVSEVHYDAALAREAALREDLAALRESYESMRDRKNSIVALQHRLTVAERRAGDSFEIAAKLIDKRIDDYANEHGSYDPETGATEYPGNGEEYVGELMEIAEGLRALKPAAEGEGS